MAASLSRLVTLSGCSSILWLGLLRGRPKGLHHVQTISALLDDTCAVRLHQHVKTSRPVRRSKRATSSDSPDEFWPTKNTPSPAPACRYIHGLIVRTVLPGDHSGWPKASLMIRRLAVE